MLIFALMCFFTYLIDCGGKVGVLKWVGIFVNSQFFLIFALYLLAELRKRIHVADPS